MMVRWMKLSSFFVVASLLLTVAANAHLSQSLDSYAPAGIGGNGPFDSMNVDLLAHMPLNTIGGGGANVFGNDIWGWTDTLTNRNYAIFGRTNGTSFIDITNPTNPLYLGNLPSRTGNAVWRDMKVYQNHAFIVSDGNGPHGLQVFDLTRLRNVTTAQTFTADAVNDDFRNAHNIAINEDTGFAYIIGSNQYAGGPLFMDIRNPLTPVLAGGFSADGYTHDTQVVVYNGPHAAFQGKEIAFSSNEDTLTIVDVSNKSTPTMLARKGYPQSGYSHQGWLSENQDYFFMDDEFDESNGASHTRTHVWDVSNLNNPVYKGYQNGTMSTIDHNLYVKGDLIFEANYTSGLRILKIEDAANALMPEVAYFDTYPNSNSVSYNGAWSVYPYFDNDVVIVSDIQNGLFVLRPDLINSDLNGDGTIDCVDIDLLIGDIVAGGNTPSFDLNSDGQVNLIDRDLWLRDAGEDNIPGSSGYLLGDATLDGIVDGSDFGAWNSNKFTSLASWCGGDFTADGVVDGSDFNMWNSNKFHSSMDGATANGVNSTQAVPEPHSLLFVGVAILLTFGWHNDPLRRRQVK